MTTALQANATRVIVAGCLLFVACAAGGDAAPISAGAINATTNRPTLTIEQGGSDTLTVTVARSGGYAGSVTVSPQSVDSALISTAIYADTTVGNVTTVRVRLAVALSSPAGVQSVTLFIQPSGTVGTARVELTVAVTARAAVYLQISQNLGAHPGAAASYSLQVHRANYVGPLTMSAANLPAGVIASFRPRLLVGTDSTVVLSIGVDSSLPVGTYPIQVLVDGVSDAPHAASRVTLIVDLAPSVTLTLAADPAGPAGGVAAAAIALARTNYDGNVTFTVSGLPAGVRLLPQNYGDGEGDALVLTFSIGASQPAGTFPLVIHASALNSVQTEIEIPTTLTITP